MEANKSKVIVLGSVALGVLLIAGMGMLMFGKDPVAAPRPAQEPAGTRSQDEPVLEVKAEPAPKTAAAAAPVKPAAPAGKPSASQLTAQAPREAGPDPKENEPATVKSTGLTGQEQWNNERNAYTIQFQERLNELEYRRVFIANGMPIERARHEALIKLYRDSIAGMQNGDASNLAGEVKRVQEEEKQIMRGARDSQLQP